MCSAIGSCNEIVTIYFRNVTLYQVESYKNLRNKYNHFQNCNVGSVNKRCIGILIMTGNWYRMISWDPPILDYWSKLKKMIFWLVQFIQVTHSCDWLSHTNLFLIGWCNIFNATMKTPEVGGRQLSLNVWPGDGEVLDIQYRWHETVSCHWYRWTFSFCVVFLFVTKYMCRTLITEGEETMCMVSWVKCKVKTNNTPGNKTQKVTVVNW